MAPAAEVLRRMPAIGRRVPAENLFIAVRMVGPDTGVMLGKPDVELDPHGHLLGLVEVAEQNGKGALLPRVGVEIKTLSRHGIPDHTHGLGAQRIEVEVRQTCR